MARFFASILLIACFLSCQSKSSDKNQPKPLLASYSGGEKGLTETHLVLYIDSTYRISSSTDDNSSNSSEGKYAIRDSSITLYPKSASINGKEIKLRDTANSYRMRKNAILLYSKEDEIKHPEVGEFETLNLDENQK